MVSACGGGSGGGSAPVAATPPPIASDDIAISGIASKGPLDSSIVNLIPINAAGEITGAPVATTTTNASGVFNANIPQGSGTLLIRVGGGSYVDEADQQSDPGQKRRIFLADNEGLEGLLPAGQTAAAVSVVTQALLDKTRREAQGDTFLQQFAANRALATSAFGFDVVGTMPANPVSPSPASTVVQRQYAMVLGGLANLINRISIDSAFAAPTIETILTVSDDLSDGRVDGMLAGVPLQVQCIDISALSLNEEIARFRNNNFSAYANTPLVVVNEDVLSQIGSP